MSDNRTSHETNRAPFSMSVRLLWPFLELARHYEPRSQLAYVMTRLGLTLPTLENPETRVPVQTAVDLLRELVGQTGVRDLGLLAAQKTTGEHLGLTEYVARSKATLRDAAESGSPLMPLLAEGCYQRIEKVHDVVIVRLWFDEELAMHQAASEFAMAARLLSLRRCAAVQTLVPLEVHFTHPEPPDAALHHQLFRCKIRFGMPHNQLIFHERTMTMALPAFERALGRSVDHHAKLTLARLQRSQCVVRRVRDILSTEPDLSEASAGRVAHHLGVSARTLARRLERENTSYRELLNEVRRAVAMRELAETRRSIVDIAMQLGFASSQGFHRAFRRWTGGDTAARYRERSHSAQQ